MKLPRSYFRSVFISIIGLVLLFFTYTWKTGDTNVFSVNAVYYTWTSLDEQDHVSHPIAANGSQAINTTSDRSAVIRPVLDILENTSVTDFSDQIDPSQSIPSEFHLWSQHPDMVNWTDTIQMCTSLLSPEQGSLILEKARNWTIPFPHTDESIADLLSDCSRFREIAHFPTKPSSKSEADFPLAYVFLGARNAAQTVRVFRSIYRPQNAYCITYDNKSSEAYKNAIRQLSSCFKNEKNVFLTPHPEPVYYELYSILHSVMVCLKVLLDAWTTIPWRYVQIVSWNDFPLRTNAEMVEIFKIFNGSQDSALDPIMIEFFVPNWDLQSMELPQPRTIPPDGLTMYKGSFATSMTKEFVEFLFTNPTSIRFYEWLNNSKCAEEQYWVSIIHNLQLNAPGAFPGQCLHFYQYRGKWKPFASRYQVWDRNWWHPPVCNGKYYKFSCVFGVGDLPSLVQRPELMAHKLYEEFEPATLFCLEYWYSNRTNKVAGTFDGSYYRNFPSVRYHMLEDKNEFIC